MQNLNGVFEGENTILRWTNLISFDPWHWPRTKSMSMLRERFSLMRIMTRTEYVSTEDSGEVISWRNFVILVGHELFAGVKQA